MITFEPIFDLALFNDVLAYASLVALGFSALTLLLWVLSAISRKNLLPLKVLFKPIALVVSLVAIFGSLSYSLSYGFVPCDLCWYTRIFVYPTSLILLFGLIFRIKGTAFFTLILSAGGIIVSGYHYALQQGYAGLVDVCSEGVSCTAQYLQFTGFLSFITIPFLALAASVTIFVLTLTSFGGKKAN